MLWPLALLAALALVLAACGDDDDAAAGDAPVERLVIGGIPDQDPDRLQRQFGLVADHLAETLGIEVVYEPVADYDAAVSAFRVGDLDLVWFGGLTGVQARLQVDGARAIAQRDIDAEFTSVFITLTDLAGEPGFSGSHDATIELVSAGTFEAGVLNSQVWDARVEDGTVDTSQVVEVFRTPPYFDYHWVVRPDVGEDLIDRIREALLALDASDADDAAVLELFGAERFIETDDDNYAEIEAVAREIGKIDS